ncbi:MAG: ribonuclease R [Deltaproteobacteria bacterium]|nr:ribonuclease R [Deltaproteobacteria bacterium]
MSKIKQRKTNPQENINQASPQGANLTGILDLTSQGYGFVILENTPGSDIFIAPPHLGGAMDGDQVSVVVIKQKGRRAEGKIVEVLKRSKSKLVGEYRQNEKFSYVWVEEGKKQFKIYVGAERRLNAVSGNLVVVEILKYPQEGKLAEGQVLQILGERGNITTEEEVIITQRQIRNVFPPEVLQEVTRFNEGQIEEESTLREDLTALPLVTIDGENARDFDDGIYVEKKGSGFKLWVAIADVSFYVKPGTYLDQEAYLRATSVYFPYRCIPMLPEALSNHLCSLVPGQKRLSFVAEMEFDAQGARKKSKFYKAIIRSAARLTYNKVFKMMIQKDEVLRAEHQFLLPMLGNALELFKSLRVKRLSRGSIDFDLPEPEIVLNIEEGLVASILRANRNEAHMLIEEFMIAANEAVGEFMEAQNLPMIYRIHETPDPQKIEDFVLLAHNLGLSMSLSDPVHPKDLSDVLKKVKGETFEKLVNTILLRSLKQAVYSSGNVGHFGLASKSYSHFTSPIRRYPDLLAHRLLEACLVAKKKKKKAGSSPLTPQELQEMAEHCSKQERKSMKAEWEIRDFYVALFMQDKIGQEFNGVISSVTRFGVFVELQDFFVEGLLPLQSLPKDSYDFDEKRHELLGKNTKQKFKIGDALKVCLVKADIQRRRIDFDWVPK